MGISISYEFTHQGYYNPTSGEYVTNAKSISSDFIRVDNILQTITQTSAIEVELYRWDDTRERWVHTNDYTFESGVSFQLFDIDRNYLTTHSLSKDTPYDISNNPLGVYLIIKYEIDDRVVVNANIHTDLPVEPYTGSGSQYWYCLKNPIDIEYENKQWIIGGTPHSHYEDATIFEPDYPTDSMPAAMWRVDSRHNNGRPWNELMRGVPYVPPPTPTIDPVEFYDEYNAEYLSALHRKHRHYKLRVELLGYYENVVGEITKDVSLDASGQITINNEQITRRSCSLSLINVDKKYLPSPDNPIWFNRKFKIWLGVVVGEKTYWWSQGVYFTQKATCDGNTVNIQGVDKGGALDGTIKTGMLDTTYTIEVNTTIANVLRDTLMWNESNTP